MGSRHHNPSKTPWRHSGILQPRQRSISVSERYQIKRTVPLLKIAISELYRSALGIFLEPFRIVLLKLDHCSQLRKISVSYGFIFSNSTIRSMGLKVNTWILRGA